MRRLPATAVNGHQYDYDFGFLWIAGSSILVIPQTQNIAGGKISGFERKALLYHTFHPRRGPEAEFKLGCFNFLMTQLSAPGRLRGCTLSGFKSFGFKVPTLDSGFKISGHMTKPGCFHFGFVVLCVNGKTNPVLKRSGFIMNP